MRRIANILIACCVLLGVFSAQGQQTTGNTEQIESLASADGIEPEDDGWIQELEKFKKDPLNVNLAGADEIAQLQIVTALQVANLLSYRRLLGKLVSIYELQSVPGWDIATIKKLLPFITVNEKVSLKGEVKKNIAGGENSLLLRMAQVLEPSDGYKNGSGSTYPGSPQHILLRYRYNYKNLLQFGILAEKDAGEQFLKGAQRQGFDFYSFHFFARKIGIVQALALGDFTVNMGQGLIQWQSLGFRKSVETMSIKRQSAVLRPYSSSGEFNFQRGAGITIKKGKLETTAFVSFRKLSANLVADSVSKENFISSLLNSGYHRTQSEVANRNNLSQISFGGNVIYRTGRWRVGLNAVYYRFYLPLHKRDEPYNLYAISGKKWYNLSAEYSYTYRNIYYFGELACDLHFNKAMVNGLLISVDPHVDLSFLYRHIAAAYQAVNGSAFTENTYPTNENGFYAGISARPRDGWRIDAYIDFYRFPWLRYLVDAPSHGSDLLAQLTYTPNKRIEIYTRYKTETKQLNQTDNTSITNCLVMIPRKNWRVQISYQLNTAFTIRSRVEMLWYGDKQNANVETGYLFHTDILYKPQLKKWSASMRIQYFESDSYNSRLYAFENDVLYSYSIPAFFDKGFRYYILINYDLTRKISCWLRLAQSNYPGQAAIADGLDKIEGNKRTEVKVQVEMVF